MCDSTAECCGGYSCIKETCTPTGEQGRSEETQERRVRIPLSVGTGFGFLPAENTKQAYNQIAPGNLSLNAGTAWDKFHVRLGVLYQLIPELALGLAFRGDMALDFNGNVPFMRPAFFVNAEYRVFSSAEERFELWSLFGLGGGIFQHRVSYKDCSVTQDKPEECANLEKDPAGRDVWTGENPVDETFFRKSGYVILEAGLGARYWFKKGGVFGWNVEILADLLFAPSFAFNFDFHTGPVLRF